MAERSRQRIFRSRIVLIGFMVIVGFFLLSEHRAHLFGVLPYLLLLACPLMHLFMHHGHGRHGHGEHDASGSQPAIATDSPIAGDRP
ncbi:hypothetical protein A0J57_11035 [Sphingobium sp. 22B]|jgi:hypothetical protein|uniref:DUF2933 domain-containing protein n=1 Tax=Sphingobium sp. AM TaxID=1176302 RepID=UPI000781EDDE|nr:hypothetical protein AXW74_07630 [Sphingobium sp. AM]KYC32193.1 hypothetical protein A0J57_11035 [Sphingobium sp. 22B]OAP31825.1 hypothetical protein A8O16_10835 [Sphingobium sp. 20006FA]